MSRALIVDGKDLSDLGFVAEQFRGHRSMPLRSLPTVDVPGRVGPVVASNVPRYQSRRLTISGALDAGTFAEMQARLDEIKYRLEGAGRTVTIADDETRQFRSVRFQEISATPFRPDLFQKQTALTIQGIAYDPRGYSTALTVSTSFASTDTAMSIGTAEVGPVVRISGTAVNPAIIYKNSASVEQARVTLGTTIGSTGYIDIDLDLFTLLDETGANVSNLLNSTASTFFVLDPLDGNYVTSAWPTLQVTAGSATATYRKAYW